jgi:single-strand DNA-binding protein
MIVVAGRLQSRKSQDRDGNNRTSWEINADNVYFGESRRDSDSNRGDNYGNSYSNNYSSNSGGSYGGGYDSNRASFDANRGGYDSGRGNNAPAPSSTTFVELDDGDGELPF